APASQVELRDGFEPTRLERVNKREIGAQGVVLDDHAVGDDRAVPTPHPVVAQRELAGRVDASAAEAMTRVLVAGIPTRQSLFERARIRLEDACRLDQVGSIHQAVTPLRLE